LIASRSTHTEKVRVAGRHLRLFCFNIHAGNAQSGFREYLTRGWRHLLPDPGKHRNLAELAKLLKEVDIAGLQEVDGGSLRSGFLNQAEYLAEVAAFPYWWQQRNRRIGQIAESGNCLLSRSQPSAVEEHPLPGRIKGRGALLAVYGEGRESLAVVMAHLSLGPQARNRQFDFLSELIAPYRHVVLMGDFNAQPNQPGFRRFLERTALRVPGPRALPTYPAWQPGRAIDHILVSADIPVLRYEAPPLALSDHLPVVVDIQPPEGVKVKRVVGVEPSG
jgi:endonuclease/exonuclease/phosphatase family metal-dependent hydrolase